MSGSRSWYVSESTQCGSALHMMMRSPGRIDPATRQVSLVGASYGLSTRTLGAVSLVGPLRMDYEKAIRSVRAAAHELSRFVESVYEDN